MTTARVSLFLMMMAMPIAACSDDSEEPLADGGTSDGGGTVHLPDGGMDAAVTLDASVDTGVPPRADATVDAGGPLALVERGRYLVENVGACGDCHTPRLPSGAPNVALALSGVDCFADAVPGDDSKGCLSSRNLTNHETGLKNRSDAEIKDMFLKGVRPDGKFLHPMMPYYVLGNMSPADANAIVAFLRTVAPVDHMVKAAQAPFADVSAAAPTWPEALIPQPRSDYANLQAAQRGRYLAGQFGVCMECHSPRDAMDAPIATRAFEGGRAFARDALGLPPVFPETIYTSNLTPDATGIMKYDVAAIVTALKRGVDEEHKPLCPPMPAGPMGAFAGLTDADAQDIAHYLLSLPPKVNAIPAECTPPGAP